MLALFAKIPNQIVDFPYELSFVGKLGQTLGTRYGARIDVDKTPLALFERLFVNVSMMKAHYIGHGRLNKVKIRSGHYRHIRLEPRKRKKQTSQRLGHQHEQMVVF
jgi:hypothetical protein